MACSSLRGLARRRAGGGPSPRRHQASQTVRLEGIGDDLEEPQAQEQVLGRRSQAGLGAGPACGHLAVRQGHGNGVIAGQAGDLFYQVHLPLQVVPEGRHLEHQVFRIQGQGRQMQPPQQVLHPLRRVIGAQHLVGPGHPQVNPGVLNGRRILIYPGRGHGAVAHLGT